VVPLAPIYRRHQIEFKQAPAVALFFEGDEGNPQSTVEIEWTLEAKCGQRERIAYDFVINATGPKLNFDATAGLGPGKSGPSVCTADHAEETSRVFLEMVERMRRGDKKRFLVGVGHGGCTCEGAALEYVVNLELELRAHKVRDKAEITFVTNEYELGDLGVDGVQLYTSEKVTLIAHRPVNRHRISDKRLIPASKRTSPVSWLQGGVFDPPERRVQYPE
jgi:sulfide:quinone oxidoreductase